MLAFAGAGGVAGAGGEDDDDVDEEVKALDGEALEEAKTATKRSSSAKRFTWSLERRKALARLGEFTLIKVMCMLPCCLKCNRDTTTTVNPLTSAAVSMCMHCQFSLA